MDTFPDNKVIEQLFLDIPIRQALTSRPGYQPLEPWVSMYADSIQERRFGDAIWARYHMFGNVVDGMAYGGNETVLGEIKEDALGYRADYTMEEYCEAMSLYTTTSPLDGRPDVIDLVMNLDERDIAETRARIEAEREEEEE